MQVKEHQGTEPSPLGPALVLFARKLESEGYPRSTRDQYLSICRAFGHYVQRGAIEIGKLCEDHVEAFLIEASAGRKLREGGRLKRGFWRRPIALLFEQLRPDGLLAEAVVPATPLGPGLAEYLAFLREHRGFSERTVARQQLQVSRLLTHLGVDSDKDAPPCGEDDVHALTVGGEPALAVQTASCNWATVEQPSRVGVEAGEPLAYRVWYYSQDAFAGATEAETSVVLGDETIAQTTLALPSTGGLLYGTIAAPLDAPKGTRVLWNVHNKGSNEYDFIELSVTRRASCPPVD
ncbi:MAG: hypothetical protein AABZ30_11080 [Myxococcota bacterium]